MTPVETRYHIVLVPGFVGFDALGQLEYYSGVTAEFAEWVKTNLADRQQHVALHFFDNIPTASVELRAERLRRYLSKKRLRGEFAPNDRVALVGHSTGCLDIRKALHELANARDAALDPSERAQHADLLAQCQRLAFMSAPHFGTALADGFCDFRHVIQAEVKNAGLGIQLNRDAIARAREFLLSRLTSTELEKAIIDVLNESDERGGDDNQHIDEREARAELGLWLEHMGRDFRIIEDLRSQGLEKSTSPAHFNSDQRAQELARWEKCQVKTRSYATRVSAAVVRDNTVEAALGLLRAARPFDDLFDLLNRAAERWAMQPLAATAIAARTALTAPPLLSILGLLHKRPELLFEIFHAMCTDPRRPFERPASLCPSLHQLDSSERIPSAQITSSDSDGIVNTLSMLWPYEAARPSAHAHVLVEADHGDIIGHYRLRERLHPSPTGRRYDAYDFFPSGSQFDGARFTAVWKDVFEFCVG